MRRFAVAAAAAVVMAGSLAACGSSTTSSAGSNGPSTATTSCTKSGIQHLLFKPGVLTVATDNPVYTPWFVNNTPVKCLL